ncbi:MAG: ribosome recycling factor [Anaerolineales bacterium]|nr:ribosome recycling factor [Anaerolineales bacterium]
MLNDIKRDAHERMTASLQVLESDLTRIRTGRATPALVENLMVEYYGQPTPLIQLASISVPEPRQIMIRPFDAGSLRDVEKSILASDLGLTPSNDGKVVRLNLPPLTEDRRRELSRMVSGRAEETRVAIRNIRRDVNRDLKEYEQEKLITEDDLKRGEEDIQKLTDDFIEKINEISENKEKEIMEV